MCAYVINAAGLCIASLKKSFYCTACCLSHAERQDRLTVMPVMPCRQIPQNLGVTNTCTHTHTFMEKHTCLPRTLITSDGKRMNHILPTDISEQIPTSGIESTPVRAAQCETGTHGTADCELVFQSKVPSWVTARYKLCGLFWNLC